MRLPDTFSFWLEQQASNGEGALPDKQAASWAVPCIASWAAPCTGPCTDPCMAAPRIAAARTGLPTAPARKQTSEKYSESHSGTVSHCDVYINPEACSHQS